MPRTYACPCCDGRGLVGNDPRREPEEIIECGECDASGQVNWSRRQELLAWRERCRIAAGVPRSWEKRRA